MFERLLHADKLNEVNLKISCANMPRGAIGHVRRSIKWINPADTVDLGFIELLDGIEEPNEASPEWHRNAFEHDVSVNGLYFRAENGSSARIYLFVRDLYRGVPRIYWFSPVITLILAQTLSHEIGHHLIATRGFVFAPGEKVYPSEYEEEMAHRYAYHVVKTMKSRWYYRLADYIIKDLASSQYIKGMFAWRKGDYEKAARCWSGSFHLNPNRNDAIYWYKRAKELSGVN